jgi:hypothetical protein
MLYRSAYAERTKAWCAANNHQVVSSVSGASWPMEPQEVRDFYNELAKIERFNHQKAHPEYKFSPAKPGDRKRKGTAEPDDSTRAIDDPDADWAASHRVRTKLRVERDASHLSREVPAEIPSEAPRSTPDIHYGRHAWVSNTMQALPVPIDQSIISAQSHYYQPALPVNLAHDGIAPYHQLDPTEFLQSSGFVGLPGASHHELLQLHEGVHDHGPPVMEAPIDPILLPYENQLPANLANMSAVNLQSTMPLQDAYGEYSTQNYAPTPAAYADSDATGDVYNPLQQDVKYEPREWMPESSGPSLEQPPEFDNYWPDGSQGEGVDHHDIHIHGLASTQDEPSELHPGSALPEEQKQPAIGKAPDALPPTQEDHVDMPIDVSHAASIGDSQSQLEEAKKQSESEDPVEKSPKTA